MPRDFFPESTFGADTFTVFAQPPFAIALTTVCVLVNTPERIRAGPDRKRCIARSGPDMILAHRLASGPDPFGQNLTVNEN